MWHRGLVTGDVDNFNIVEIKVYRVVIVAASWDLHSVVDGIQWVAVYRFGEVDIDFFPLGPGVGHYERFRGGDGGGGLDYGGILVIHHKKWNFSATYTNHTVYFAAAITWGN